jgi:hypothetical protein
MTFDRYSRKDRFEVGDEVWWNIPVVMDCCNTWAPDITKPTKIIAVRDRPPSFNGKGHSQMVRVLPNYCPWGDEFEGTWLLPTGVLSHNDRAYREACSTTSKDRNP